MIGLSWIVPEQVAVPFESVACVGGAVAPVPPEVMMRGVPEASEGVEFTFVNWRVAVAPVDPLLKSFTLHVCPAVPVTVPPDR